MKKKVVTMLTCLLFLFSLFPLTVQAAELDQQTEEQLAESGLAELAPLIPDEGKDILSDPSLSRGDLTGWSLQAVLSWIGNTFLDKIKAPLCLLGTLCGILLLSAMLRAFSGGLEQNTTSAAFTTAGTLCVSAALTSSVIPLIRSVSQTIDSLSNFMLSFIPVFTGVIAVSGRPASAAAYQSITFAAAQIFARLADSLIVPLIGIFLAICTIGAVTDGIDIRGIAQAARSLAGWVLGLCLTVFVALLTLQSLTTGAADTVSNRAVKFVISSAVPVVGGALSDAYSSLFGCLGMVKSAVGIFGVIVMAASFVPILAQIGASMLALSIAAAVGDTLGEGRAAGVIRSVSAALSVLGGLILCYGMMILSSSAILLWMGTPQ